MPWCCASFHFLRVFWCLCRILIKFNVNHTVDAEEPDFDEGAEQSQVEQEPPKIQSKPKFEVDIVKGDTTLSLTCSYLDTVAVEGEYGK